MRPARSSDKDTRRAPAAAEAARLGLAHRVIVSLLITALLAAFQVAGSVTGLDHQVLSTAALNDRPWDDADLRLRDNQVVPRKPSGSASFETRSRALPVHAGDDFASCEPCIVELPATRLREGAPHTRPRHAAPPQPPARAYHAHAPPLLAA
jgi:hypothetical protein